MVVRPATLDDVDGIVDVVLVAMPHDPQWDYRFVHKKQFADDHRKYTRLLFESFVDPANSDWLVMIVERRPSDGDGPSQIVAFAVWDVSYIEKQARGIAYKPQDTLTKVANAGGAQRRDVVPQRQQAFRDAAKWNCQRFFDRRWRDRQLRLQILGVRPNYWRNKYGSELVRWGMKKATEYQVSLTLTASPLGALLYSSLGFSKLGDWVIQVPGEMDKVESAAFVYEPPSKPNILYQLDFAWSETHSEDLAEL